MMSYRGLSLDVFTEMSLNKTSGTIINWSGVYIKLIDYYCQTSADHGEVTWPGNPGLAGTDPSFNDLMSSWSCDGDIAIFG
jgi:hypothetical protein